MALRSKTRTELVALAGSENQAHRVSIETAEVVLIMADALLQNGRPAYTAEIPNAEAALRVLYARSPGITKAFMGVANEIIRYFIAAMQKAEPVTETIAGIIGKENIH